MLPSFSCSILDAVGFGGDGSEGCGKCAVGDGRRRDACLVLLEGFRGLEGRGGDVQEGAGSGRSRR